MDHWEGHPEVHGGSLRGSRDLPLHARIPDPWLGPQGQDVSRGVLLEQQVVPIEAADFVMHPHWGKRAALWIREDRHQVVNGIGRRLRLAAILEQSEVQLPVYAARILALVEQLVKVGLFDACQIAAEEEVQGVFGLHTVRDAPIPSAGLWLRGVSTLRLNAWLVASFDRRLFQPLEDEFVRL